jgi:hypothetical protein
MSCAEGVEAVQAGLRYDNRPVGVSAASLSQKPQHLVLNRVSHLHHDQQRVGLPLNRGREEYRGTLRRLGLDVRAVADRHVPPLSSWRVSKQCGAPQPRISLLPG